jgi:hypothetical protein
MSNAADHRARFRARRMTTARAAIAVALLALAGCATTPPGGAPDASRPDAAVPGTPGAAPPPAAPPAPAPRNVEPPPPKMNLSGFPLPYRQGYADGCASATGPERKDASRFSADLNYRTGWTDGLGLCKKK